MTDTPTWYQTLTRLLTAGFDPDGPATGGAQLTVTDPAGAITAHHPLARHARLGDDCVWIRPILGAGPDFDLTDCRRRGLPTTAVTDTDGTVGFNLADGAQAVVEPAAAELVEILDRWDSFVLTRIDASTETALAALDADTIWP